MTRAFLECIHEQYHPRKHILVCPEESCIDIKQHMIDEKWAVGLVEFHNQETFLLGVTYEQLKASYNPFDRKQS